MKLHIPQLESNLLKDSSGDMLLFHCYCSVQFAVYFSLRTNLQL